MMMIALFALFLVAAQAHIVPIDDLANYTFDRFLQDFRPQYSAAEIAQRKQLFHQELKRVLQHNAQKLSWKETINKFSAMTTEEKRAFMGRNKNAASKKAQVSISLTR
jgi:hypothetical protein